MKEPTGFLNKSTINRRMEWLPGHDIQYTPLSIALFTGQLDMAEKYLEDFKNTLDVAVINTHGSTALSEAITQYKNRRFTGSDSESICLQLKRYKAIILELIKRSPVDALYAETVKGRISDLEEAINGDQCF